MYITEPEFLPFLNASSVQKWKKKIYKQNTELGKLCRAIKLFIISAKIYAVIMVKVTFEIKSNTLFRVKKVLPAAQVTYFFATSVIGNEQFFKIGLSPL